MKDSIINRVFNVAPFLMIGVSLLSSLLYNLEFYPEIYLYLPDLFGYSILTDIVFIKVYFRSSFCNTTKIAVIGLIAINTVSLLTKNTDYYNSLYDVYISGVVLFLIISYKIKRWN